jgi:hypothetical protein
MKLLDDGIIAGSLAGGRGALANFAVTLGLAGKDSKTAEQVAQTHEYLAQTADVVLAQVGRIGGGKAMSENDRKFLEQASARTVENNPVALKRILEAIDRNSRSALATYRGRVQNIPESERWYYEPPGDGADDMAQKPGESRADYIKRISGIP